MAPRPVPRVPKPTHAMGGSTTPRLCICAVAGTQQSSYLTPAHTYPHTYTHTYTYIYIRRPILATSLARALPCPYLSGKPWAVKRWHAWAALLIAETVSNISSRGVNPLLGQWCFTTVIPGEVSSPINIWVSVATSTSDYFQLQLHRLIYPDLIFNPSTLLPNMTLHIDHGFEEAALTFAKLLQHVRLQMDELESIGP